MKAQAVEKREEYDQCVQRGTDAGLQRALFEAVVSWDDATFRVHMQARKEWWRAEEARMRAARRWTR